MKFLLTQLAPKRALWIVLKLRNDIKVQKLFLLFSCTSAHTCTGDGSGMVARAGLPLEVTTHFFFALKKRKTTRTYVKSFLSFFVYSVFLQKLKFAKTILWFRNWKLFWDKESQPIV